jgi:hypothetical protein
MDDTTYILKRGPHIQGQPTAHEVIRKEEADLTGYSYLDKSFNHLSQVNLEEWVPTDELEIYKKMRSKK